MKLDVKRVHEYAGTNFAQRNYIEGQHVLWSGFVVKCGSLQNSGSAHPNLVKIHSECVQSSHIKDQVPFIVTGEIQKDGKIRNFICSCPAGDSGQCKHTIATLLYCYFKGPDLQVLSSTDVTCSWNKLRNETLKLFKAMPLEDHPCFFGQVSAEIKEKKKVFQRPQRKNRNLKKSSTKDDRILSNSNILNTPNSSQSSEPRGSCTEVLPESSSCAIQATPSKSKQANENASAKRKTGDEDPQTYILSQIKKFKAMPEFSETELTEMLECRDELVSTGLVKEILGRHSEILVEEFSKVSDYDRQIYKFILDNQYSNLLESVELFTVKPLEMCCEAVMAKLRKDPLSICENTRNYFAEWSGERKYRATGTSAYELHTYLQGNHDSKDWKNKIENFISPRNFSTEATEYGLKNEAPAREVFKSQNPNFEVIETGLIVCKQLPWIACSPDGVIVEGGKPVSLLEIKCFTSGKTEGIDAVVEKEIKKGCLRKINDVIVLREKNKYYGQVQLGMALLNVANCKFVLYSSFDKNIFVVNVAKDVLFLRNMLTGLKDLYYGTILPEICFLESCDQKSSLHANGEHLIVQNKSTKSKQSKAATSQRKPMSDLITLKNKTKAAVVPLSPKSSKVRL